MQLLTSLYLQITIKLLLLCSSKAKKPGLGPPRFGSDGVYENGILVSAPTKVEEHPDEVYRLQLTANACYYYETILQFYFTKYSYVFIGKRSRDSAAVYRGGRQVVGSGSEGEAPQGHRH